jgi:hypothetical protein
MSRNFALFVAAAIVLLALSAAPLYAQSPDPLTVSFAEVCGDVTLENPQPSPLCLEVMRQRPVPSYTRAPLDTVTINNYSFWKVTNGAAQAYATPGGGLTRAYGGGFVYVRAIDESVPGWIQIEGGDWLKTEDLEKVAPSEVTGLLIDDGLKEEYAYILGTVITSTYPGGPADTAVGGVYKYYYNLIHIFATVELNGWKWYMIGENQWVEQRSVAKVHLTPRPEGVSGRWVAVDLYEQTLVAYEDDTPVFSTIIASGLPGWETNEGIFEVWYRVPNGSMSGAFGAPDAYALQSVPWTLYFDEDISLHGTYWHNAFGFRRSHGCVNLSISDARWLYEWTLAAEGPVNEDGALVNYIYIYHSEKYA